jgi:hypothetical protein
MLKFATDNGITSKFFELAGHTYTLNDKGQLELLDDKNKALAAGVKPDMSNVQVIKPNKTYPSGIIGEYLFYADQVKASGKQPLDFNSYQTMDANRKARANGSTSDQKAAAKTVAENDMESKLQGVMGKSDHYVSPEDWNYYRNIWKQAGHAASDFDKTFVHYANPGTKDNNLLKNYVGLQ